MKALSLSRFISYDQEQDKSSDIEQQPPFGDRKISNIQPQNRGGQNQQEHHIIFKVKVFFVYGR